MSEKHIIGRNHPASIFSQPGMAEMVDWMKTRASRPLVLADDVEIPWSSTAVINMHSAIQQSPASGYTAYAVTEWALAGKQYWKLDADVVEAFLKTEPPIGMLTELPRLPYRCLYCEVPAGMYTIANEETGDHDAWGFYIVDDLMMDDPQDPNPTMARKDRPYDARNGTWRRAISLVAAGEIRHAKVTAGGVDFDDAIVFGKWADTADLAGDNFPPMKDTWRLAINLLIALQGGYLGMKKMTPLSDKKSPGKRKILERRGVCDHTVISLSAKAKTAQKASAAAEKEEGATRAVKPHIRRGHWRKTWVLDPKDDAVVSKQEREDKAPLHAVLRWIPPTQVGKGDPAPKTVRVKL